MILPVRVFVLLLAACLCLPLAGCKPKHGRLDPYKSGSVDPVLQGVLDYRSATRTSYNNRRFDELEANADLAGASRARFGDGSWKIAQFYDSLGCADTEPEGMWQLHDAIHKSWIAAKPGSTTARVAQVLFYVEYAWHARTARFADKVTPEGWRLFGERLGTARQALIDCRAQGVKCPEWWTIGMKIALGQQWPRATYEQFYAQAKELEPAYWYFDTSRSNFLALKWYGHPGDWETAADAAAAAPDGLGLEIYSRCVLTQLGNYRDVFKESRASYAKTQAGFELMERRYPGSLEVVSAHCRVACAAGDRATAKRLFDHLGENFFVNVWFTRDYWQRCRTWAGESSGSSDYIQRLVDWLGSIR